MMITEWSLCESLNQCESVNSALPLATIGTQESVAQMLKNKK